MGSTRSEDNWSWIHGESAILCYRALGTCRKSASLGAFLTWRVCVWCVRCVLSTFLNTNDQALSAKARTWLPLRREDSFIQTCTSLLLCCKSSPGPLPIVGWVTGRVSFVRILPLLCRIKMCIHGNGPPSSALSATCSESQRVCPPWSWWLHPGDCPALLGCCVSVPTSNHKELKSTLFSKNTMVFEYKVCTRLLLCSNWVEASQTQTRGVSVHHERSPCRLPGWAPHEEEEGSPPSPSWRWACSSLSNKFKHLLSTNTPSYYTNTHSWGGPISFPQNPSEGALLATWAGRPRELLGHRRRKVDNRRGRALGPVHPNKCPSAPAQLCAVASGIPLCMWGQFNLRAPWMFVILSVTFF